MGAKQSDSATMVFARKVKAGQHEQYEEWLRSVSHATSGFDGYGGTTIIRPATNRAEFVNTAFSLAFYASCRHR